MAALVVFGPEQRAAINKAMAYARANVVTTDQLRATMAGDRPPAGDYLEHIVVLPVGFRCVFSYEEQPFGLCRRLSVSVHDKSDPDHARVPAPHVMNLIGKEFGFTDGRLDGFWIEAEAGAANIIQRVETDVDIDETPKELIRDENDVCPNDGIVMGLSMTRKEASKYRCLKCGFEKKAYNWQAKKES